MNKNINIADAKDLDIKDADALIRLPENRERPRVLVADDDREIRRAIEFILRFEFDVTTVKSGDLAVERIQADKGFDVVSLDLYMPGRTGIETLKDIKELDPSVEVLIMTANSDLESARKALKYGAYDYIDKPFNNRKYREAIREGVERRRKSLVTRKAKEQLDFVQAQLKQSEKFAVIGQLIAGVVHDLNNSLNSVIGFSDLLMIDEFPPEENQEYLKNINEGANLCKNIVQKLLAFARKEATEKVPVNLNDIVNSTLALKRHDFKVDKIEVLKNIAPDIPSVTADFYEIQQVLLNIITNAHHEMKSMEGARKLTVHTESDNTAVRVLFQDSGKGIPKEHLQKIFEPLFTTKEKGTGTGLGLSVCYDIIRDHNGTIYVASKSGQGACFIVELPVGEGIAHGG
jgi:signal transduction histidine kinase